MIDEVVEQEQADSAAAGLTEAYNRLWIHWQHDDTIVGFHTQHSHFGPWDEYKDQTTRSTPSSRRWTQDRDGSGVPRRTAGRDHLIEQRRGRDGCG